jgi:non-heme chloroperoxidase
MSVQYPIKPRPPGARKRSSADRANARQGCVASASTHRSPFVSHGYVKSCDGTRLFYSVEGTGKPLIFCYGLVCSSLHWTYQIEYFRKSYQSVWFDYRGHQNSDTPKNLSSLTLDSTARDLGLILDELNIQDAVILGHSMGVNVVLEFYRQQPHRVAAMILANGTAQRPLETLFNHNVVQAGFSVLRMLYRKSPKLMLAFWKSQKGSSLARALVSLGGFNPHLTPQKDIELYIEQVAEMDPAILFQLIENYESYDATAWLHTVKVPTLIVSGANDRMIPLQQQELIHQLIPKSQLEVIQRGSHCPQMDLPDLVNHKIEIFLNSVGY